MYITGSKAFFEGMQGFIPSDTDKIEFQERRRTDLIRYKDRKESIFSWNSNLGKQGIKEHLLKTENYMYLGMFLVPDIAKHLEVNIDDIKELQEYFHKCDYKHQYLAIICDSYIENNDFILTDEQRLKAYNLYRTTRGLDKL